MKRINLFILGIIFFLIIVIIGGIIFAYKVNDKPIQTYSTQNQSHPQVGLSSESVDLGEMSISDVKSADFIIKNIGNKPLQINNISTSCDCTFAQVTIGDKVSPKFMTQQNSQWTGEIQSGQEAKVTATYQPALKPVKGKVERTVYVKTNDPQKPDITLTITAIVN